MGVRIRKRLREERFREGRTGFGPQDGEKVDPRVFPPANHNLCKVGIYRRLAENSLVGLLIPLTPTAAPLCPGRGGGVKLAPATEAWVASPAIYLLKS